MSSKVSARKSGESKNRSEELNKSKTSNSNVDSTDGIFSFLHISSAGNVIVILIFMIS
jgi:hypothetical protein